MSQILLPSIFATFLCLFGFFKRPKSAYELLMPRFAVPGIIWVTTVGQAIFYSLELRDSMFAGARELYGPAALNFVCFSLLAFWLGFILPIGRGIATPLQHIRAEMAVNPARLRKWGFISSTLLFLILLAVAGGQALDYRARSVGLLGRMPLATGVLGPFVHMLMGLSACLIGIAWPQKGQRNPFNIGLSLFFLLLACSPYMANFSRASGLPVLLAFASHAVVARRLSWFWGLVALLWLALCSHAGLQGRMVWGHHGGLLLYLNFLFTESFFDWGNVLPILLTGTNDGFTPLCVSIQATGMADLRPLPPLQWVIFQLPVPRWFGIHPDWSFDLTRAIGGAGSWGYTCGLLGDLYGHFGYAGVLGMTVLGVLYRMVERINQTSPHLGAFTVNPYLIFMFISYSALMTGMFNTFRAWVVVFFFPLYAMIAFLIFWQMFFKRRNYGDAEYLQPDGMASDGGFYPSPGEQAPAHL